MKYNELSINIQLFRDVDTVNKIYTGSYSHITIFEEQKLMALNPVVFYSDGTDKNYFMTFCLIENVDNNIKATPLGDFLIFNKENHMKKYGVSQENHIGIFDGTFGTVATIFYTLLKQGKYEMAVIGKIINTELEIKEIRNDIKIGDFSKMKVYTSFPFNVSRSNKL